MKRITTMTESKLEWKCNTPALLKEIVNCHPSPGPLPRAVQIFANILYEVGKRSAELNDPVLNHLMCRLSIYEIADQYNINYDKKAVKEIEEKYLNHINNESTKRTDFQGRGQGLFMPE